MYRPFEDRTARQPNAQRPQETTQAPRFERVDPSMELQRLTAEMRQLETRMYELRDELTRVKRLVKLSAPHARLEADELPLADDTEISDEELDGWIDRSSSPATYRKKLTGRLASLESEYTALRERRDTPEPPTWELRS